MTANETDRESNLSVGEAVATILLMTPAFLFGGVIGFLIGKLF